MLHTVTASGVLFVTLNQPERRNALTEAMLGALETQLARAERDEALRAFVLRGAGGNFCAGGDFASFKALLAAPARESKPDPVARNNRAFGALLVRLAQLPLPTIAAVSGAAAGGGTGLAATCDLVLAHSSATFATPETTLGFAPAQVAPFIADRIGRRAAARLLCAGRRLSAAEALAVGLADAVVDDLRAALLDELGRLERAEPAALRATKRILAHGGARATQLDFAADAFARGLRSNAEEGLAAFTARRAPVWRQALEALPEMPL